MAGAELIVVRRVLTESRDVIDHALQDSALQSVIVEIAATWVTALRGGGKILLCGNGGSAGDAQHIAGELVSRFLFDRPALAGIALTVDTSVLTAIGNDYGYEQTFSRQVAALGRPGDVLVGISTSGSSPNIIAALRAGKDAGLTTVGFTGNREGAMDELCDLVLRAPSGSTPLIQQVHITVGHIVCQLVEQAMFGKAIPDDGD
jgi:D-sedoheptulose 7-phosphate isomerase